MQPQTDKVNDLSSSSRAAFFLSLSSLMQPQTDLSSSSRAAFLLLSFSSLMQLQNKLGVYKLQESNKYLVKVRLK